MTAKMLALSLLAALSGSFPVLFQGAAEQIRQESLADVVMKRPFPEYAKWWPLGNEFSTFMSDAIVAEWSALPGNDGSLAMANTYAAEYVKTVYRREARSSLAEEFARKRLSRPLQSGEFDALSYAFFRSAFELIQRHRDRYSSPVETERRLLTRRVGKRFFASVHDHLRLTLPRGLDDPASIAQLKGCIGQVLAFLKSQGYFRDRAAFRFDVDAPRKSGRIRQSEGALLEHLKRDGQAYALFEMSYPIILPSAVYLFQTVGEAQHHSSRTVEELFARVGYEASETPDFDPSGYPSDLVVELWQIRKR